MNKEKSRTFTKLLRSSVHLFLCIIGLFLVVNPSVAAAKDAKAQKSEAIKSSKKNRNSKKTKKDDTKASKKPEIIIFDTQEPADELPPQPSEQVEPAPSETPTDNTTTDATPELASTAAPEESTKTDKGYRISVGPLLGIRTMKMQGNRSAYEHNAPFYMGGMVDGELRLHRFSRFDGELWLQADAGYGSTIGGFGHEDLANRSTAMAFVSGQFLLKRNFGEDWDMHFGLGMQALSLTVEPNKTYTGHRYIGPQIGIQARRWFDNRRLSLGTELYALPVLWMNQSTQTNDAQSFGFRAGAELGWSPGQASWALRLRYRFQRYRSQFPLAIEGSRGAVSEDNQHLLMLMLSY